MLIDKVILLIFGVLFGMGVACGFIAFIMLIGVVSRLASITKTAKRMLFYEEILMLGIGFFNIIYLFPFTIPIGQIGMLIVGLFTGGFIGCLSGALAEVINIFPIISRRAKLRKGLPYIIYALALGKGAGALLHFFFLKI